jgi:CRISPR-associated protein Csd2
MHGLYSYESNPDSRKRPISIMDTQVLKTHIALVLLVDFKNCNPQGDPDRDNAPRTDDATGYGVISPMGPKRKIRDYLAMNGNTIYVSRGACYETQNKPIFEAVGVEAPPPDENAADADEVGEGEGEDTPAVKSSAKKGALVKKAKRKVSADQAQQVYQTICKKYLDARLFGQPVPGLPGTCRGPIQFGWGESVEPVTPLRASITRVAVATEKDVEKQQGANRMMGGVWYIPYGLYRFHIYINPSDARSTGCTEADYAEFIRALTSMFDADRSSGRTSSCIRALYEFKMNDFETMHGALNIERLLESVQVLRKEPGKDARSFSDYRIAIPNMVQNHKDFAFTRLVSEVNPYTVETDALAAE